MQMGSPEKGLIEVHVPHAAFRHINSVFCNLSAYWSSWILTLLTVLLLGMVICQGYCFEGICQTAGER